MRRTWIFQSRTCPSACSLGLRWRNETSELPLQKPSKSNRRAILKVGSDDLHPNGQTRRRLADRSGGSRQTASRSWIRPDKASIGVRIGPTVDVELPRLERLGMVVRERRNSSRWIEYDVELAEQRAPLLL